MKTLTHVASDNAYASLEKSIAQRIASLKGPLFTTDAADLWKVYLDNLPSDRQHYNCTCCRRFIEKYGTLAAHDRDGQSRTSLWEVIPDPFFAESLALMHIRVMDARITGVFINDAAVWGTPQTGPWSHLSGTASLPVQGTRLKTAHQIAAEKSQDYGILSHTLADFSLDAVKQAVRVLEADALDRSEKTLGVAKWLLDLHERTVGKDRRTRERILWHAVATAPPGFCHVRSTMISTLLEDIIAGLPYETIARRWAQKMHPLQYQRPTAPPSEGAIARANEIVSKLEAEGSLARRFARLEEVDAYWKPKEVTPTKEDKPTGGVFDHLRQQRQTIKPLELPASKMTWQRFAREVLPDAHTIELQTPAHGAYFGMVSAVNPEAPPILQWDFPDRRNPVSWFFFHGGSSAATWSLVSGAWVKVNAICHKPPMWFGKEQMFAHQGEAAFLVLEGCKLRERTSHGGFFPECLKSEFHEIRSVMEAYARRAEVVGAGEGTANGYALQKGQEYGVVLRVNGADLYRIDRWE